jgi:hypothetical protein
MRQVDYYFSLKNLDQDEYIRKTIQDDPDQAFPIAKLLDFNRIRQTGVNKEKLVQIIKKGLA